MTEAGLIRLFARRMAMLLISWTDQRINGGEALTPLASSSGGFVLGGGMLVAWRRMAAIIAKASMTSETWRCQPCHERVSLCSSPSSFLAVSKLSSIALRCPLDQGFDACSSRTPGAEKRQVTISDVAADQ
jgi:hypothetical protein